MLPSRSLRGPMYTSKFRLSPHPQTTCWSLARIPRSSYYEADYRQGKALLRARRPYIVKNAITGACILAFTVSICMLPFYPFLFYSPFLTLILIQDVYTLRAVSQDEFEDVQVPAEAAETGTAKIETVEK